MADIGHNGAPAVAQLSYSDLKLIRTRSAFQVVLEGPIEEAEAFIGMFGVPRPGSEVPVAVARLNVPTEALPEPAKPAPDSRKSEAARAAYLAKAPIERLAAKAGILCNDPVFWRWFERRLDFVPGRIGDAETCADFLRRHLKIASRAELATEERARNAFLDLLWQYEHRDDPNV